MCFYVSMIEIIFYLLGNNSLKQRRTFSTIRNRVGRNNCTNLSKSWLINLHFNLHHTSVTCFTVCMFYNIAPRMPSTVAPRTEPCLDSKRTCLAMQLISHQAVGLGAVTTRPEPRPPPWVNKSCYLT